MAVMELTVTQRYYGQLVINRFHYISSGVPAAVSTSFGLIKASGFLAGDILSGNFPSGSLAAAMQTLQPSALSYVSAMARDLYSNVDFYETPYASGVNGTNGVAEGLSPASAYGLYSNRVRTDVRRGQKRICGVMEAFSGGGGYLAGDGVPRLDALAVKMGAVLSYDDEGNTITYSPAVLGLSKLPAGAGEPVKYALYPTAEEQVAHSAVGILWSAYPTVRTQVTRQYGRGS